MPKLNAETQGAKRSHIIEAAIACLTRNGLAGTSIRDVLAEAGVSQGAFYSHFGSKAELAAAVAERLIAAEAEDAAGDPASYAELVFRRPGALAPALAALRSEMQSDESGPEVLRELNESLARSISGLLPAGVRDPLALAELCDLVWDGLARRHATASFVTSYERVGSQFIGLVRPT
jgi:AcrR family transcriptional regulator